METLSRRKVDVYCIQETIYRNVSGLASRKVWEAGSGHCGESSKHLKKFRVGTLNINALRGRVCEVLETLSHRKVDICVFRRPYTVVASAAQSRAKTPGARSTGLETTKALLVLGVFMAKEWIEKVFEVQSLIM